MTQTTLYRWSIALLLSLCFRSCSLPRRNRYMLSRPAATLTGTITDSKGGASFKTRPSA